MQTAYLALGANLGDRRAALRGARDLLGQSSGMQVLASSSLYETEPVGGPKEQGAYLNAVLEIRTALSPQELMHLCLAVESRFGRRRLEHWGPRTLDIDLLFFGSEIRRLPDLMIPHPRLHQRPFVLQPLNELAPAWIHPLLGRTVGELAVEAGTQGVRRLSPPW